MRACWWTRTLPLIFVAVGPSAQTAFANDLQELSRSVRWSHLALQTTAPDDLTVDVLHNPSTLRYAEFVYGFPDSPRIAIVVAEAGEAGFVLYVDRDRNRGIRERDRVEGSGELRMLSLAAQQVVGDVVDEHPRQVLFRWQGGAADLEVATATRAEHAVHLDGDATGRDLKTRQIDGNANGLFADAKDLIQVDLNSDDRFDPFLETFPFRPVMDIGGRRWFTMADPFGKRLRLESATATGRVRVAAHAGSEQDRITDLIVTLCGEDGSVFSLSGVAAASDLPVGRYAASVLFIAVKAERTNLAWEFTFSRSDAVRATDWLQVREGETVEFDPIGDLVLDAVVERPEGNETASLNVQPRLFTGSGLLINRCQVDRMNPRSGPRCEVSLTDADGQSLEQSSSGFS